MAANEKSIKLNFRAEMKDLLKNLQLAGMSADDAKAAIKNLTKEFNKANAAAKKLAADQAIGMKQMDAGVKGLEKAGALLGGTMGQVTGALGDMFDMVGAGGGALGTAGVAAGLFVGGLVAVAGGAWAAYEAMDSLAEGTRAALERLAEIDGAEEPSLAAANALAEWDQSSLQLEAGLASLKQEIGAELLPAAADLVQLGADLVSSFVDTKQALDPLVQSAQDWVRTVAMVTSFGLTEVLLTQSEAAGDAAGTMTDLTSITAGLTAEEIALGLAYGTLVDEVQEAKDAEDAAAEARRRGTAATAEAAAAERDRQAVLREQQSTLEAMAGAQERMQAIRGAADADLLTVEQSLAVAYRSQVAEVTELERISGDHALAQSTRQALYMQYNRELTDARVEAEKEVAAAHGEAIAAQNLFDELRLAKIQEGWAAFKEFAYEQIGVIQDAINVLFDNGAELASRMADKFQEAADAATTALEAARAEYEGNVRRMTEQEKAAAEARIAAMENEVEVKQAVADRQTEIAQDAAMKAYEMQKGLAIISATMDAAKAYMALLPALAYLGFGAPIAAAGIAGGALTLQIAAIESTPPPTFHQGGIAELEGDEGLAILRRGEPVLTPGAGAELGRDEIDRLNGGQRQSSESVNEVLLDRRSLGRAIGKVTRRKKQQRTGVAPTYRRS